MAGRKAGRRGRLFLQRGPLRGRPRRTALPCVVARGQSPMSPAIRQRQGRLGRPSTPSLYAPRIGSGSPSPRSTSWMHRRDLVDLPPGDTQDVHPASVGGHPARRPAFGPDGSQRRRTPRRASFCRLDRKIKSAAITSSVSWSCAGYATLCRLPVCRAGGRTRSLDPIVLIAETGAAT